MVLRPGIVVDVGLVVSRNPPPPEQVPEPPMMIAGRLLRASLPVLILFLGLAAHGANLTIRVRVPADSGTVYLAGSIPALGPWDPHKFPMQGDGVNRAAMLQLPAGSTLEFKFTLGSWETVETTPTGGFTTNRSCIMPGTGDATYAGAVEAWGSGKSAPRKSTASASVSILST